MFMEISGNKHDVIFICKFGEFRLEPSIFRPEIQVDAVFEYGLFHTGFRETEIVVLRLQFSRAAKCEEMFAKRFLDDSLIA